eukprot:504362_1
MTVFSKPALDSNKHLFTSIRRNLIYGFILGVIITAIQFRKAIIKRFNTSKSKQIEQETSLSLTLRIIKYLSRFPLFITTFSIAFKYLKNKNLNKQTLSLLTFITTFIIHRCFGIFNLNLSIYLITRALYGYLCYIIPSYYHLDSFDSSTILHGIMSMYLGYFNGYVPPTFWKALEQSVGERKSTWYFMLGNHNHGQTPPCQRCVHTNINEKSCLKSFIFDGYGRTQNVSTFYFKFLLIPMTIKLLIKYRNNKLNIQIIQRSLYQLLRNVIGASGYFLFGVHCTSRIMCFHRWFIGKLQNEYKLSNNKQSYEIIANNNFWSLVILCCIFGRLGALCQARQRVTDVAIASVWMILLQSIRMIYDIESTDNTYQHWLLGSNTFYSLLVAWSISLNIWTFYSDKTCVKGLEKSMIDNFLVK